MNVRKTSLKDLLITEPDVHGDDRGWFLETYQTPRYANIGVSAEFVQDNVSQSRRGVLRGLHFQNPNAQGKLVQVLAGEVFDVAVDLRRDSATFGRWHGEYLSSENHAQMWLPVGFAHGFCVTTETAIFCYKCTALYDPDSEHGLRWDDPRLGIDWPVDSPSVSAKDRAAPLLDELDSSVLFNIGKT